MGGRRLDEDDGKHGDNRGKHDAAQQNDKNVHLFFHPTLFPVVRHRQR